MELLLPTAIANAYKSPSQKIHVMTEQWVRSMVFCPNCGN
jgi:hypothetical protein